MIDNPSLDTFSTKLFDKQVFKANKIDFWKFDLSVLFSKDKFLLVAIISDILSVDIGKLLFFKTSKTKTFATTLLKNLFLLFITGLILEIS